MTAFAEEIQNHLASLQNGAIRVKNLPAAYPAFVFHQNQEYGIAVPYLGKELINEHFSDCRFYSQNLTIDNATQNYLVLSSTNESLHHEFGIFCIQFVDPGTNGEDRDNLLNAPIEWWQKWSELLGNTISDKAPYSVIAEMAILNFLYRNDKSIEWSPVNSGSNDIESPMAGFEVKSTISRYGSEITIAGQHQLLARNDLTLFFCRMEQSPKGLSIQSMSNVLIHNGYSKDKIEAQLKSLNYEAGSQTTKKSYKFLEVGKYPINAEFPRIVNDSFKIGHLPDGIIKITYSLSLAGLQHQDLTQAVLNSLMADEMES